VIGRQEVWGSIDLETLAIGMFDLPHVDASYYELPFSKAVCGSNQWRVGVTIMSDSGRTKVLGL
jgi:hypothetical protein